eukprot:10367811-Alexandrium_andersonii.AAC.1
MVTDARTYIRANIQTDHFPLVISARIKLGAKSLPPAKAFRANFRLAPEGAAEAYARAMSSRFPRGWTREGAVDELWDRYSQAAQEEAERHFPKPPL